MNKAIDRIIIILLLFMNMYVLDSSSCIFLVLVAIIYTGFSFYLADMHQHFLLSILVAIPGLFVMSYMPLLALIIYESISYSLKYPNRHSELPIIGIISIIYTMRVILFWEGSYIQKCCEAPVSFGFIGCAIALGVYLAISTQNSEKMKETAQQLRDDSEEIRVALVEKNKYLMQQQNDRLTMPTLQERNRIAREIHDNVGHLITRSIVQMGALRAVYTEEPLASTLSQVSATLDESMNNIRASVHDLHNDSFNLQKSIYDLSVKNDFVKSVINYNISSGLCREIKYCFYSIIVEAYQNIRKHSNADTVYIDLEEHNAFYKMVIKDNGINARINENGIGLHNMESRVNEFNGSITFSVENGFQIYISIPKEKEKNDEGNSSR